MHIFHVVAVEIHQLAHSINLCLVCILRLPYHGYCIKLRTIRSCNQICRFKKYGCPALPIHRFPRRLGFQGCSDSHFNITFIPLMINSKQMFMVMWRTNFFGVIRTNFLTVNYHRNVQTALV